MQKIDEFQVLMWYFEVYVKFKNIQFFTATFNMNNIVKQIKKNLSSSIAFVYQRTTLKIL